jgi:hypothetical protein
MHVSSALNAIKKQGTFKAYKEACKANVEQREVAKQAKDALALLTAPTSEGEKDSKKAAGKNRSEKEKAPQKTKKGAALANASAPELCKEYKAVYNKASSTKETPRTGKKPLLPRCFSSTQTCCLQMPSRCGTR